MFTHCEPDLLAETSERLNSVMWLPPMLQQSSTSEIAECNENVKVKLGCDARPEICSGNTEQWEY